MLSGGPRLAPPPAFPYPLHVIHVPKAVQRWKRWPLLVDLGLAVEEPAVTPDEIDLEAMTKTGRLGCLASWRIFSRMPPIDRCVLTSKVQVACLYSHLRLLRMLAASGDDAWATAEDDIDPNPALVYGLPAIAAGVSALDPEWDLVAMAAWDINDYVKEPRHGTVSVPNGVGPVHIARVRYLTGTGAQLISRRGARKLIPLLEHTDTHVDKVVGLAADMDLLRVYNATRINSAGQREPYMPLGAECENSTLEHNKEWLKPGALSNAMASVELPVLHEEFSTGVLPNTNQATGAGNGTCQQQASSCSAPVWAIVVTVILGVAVVVLAVVVTIMALRGKGGGRAGLRVAAR